MIKYTVEIEYEHNVNHRLIISVVACNVSRLVHLVENHYFGEDGESAVVLRIIKQEEV